MQYQDRSSERNGYHAAHVVRVSDIHSTLKYGNRYTRYYNELRNFGGHTHIVRIYANVWKGLGGDIDRLQSELLDELNIIDFSSDLNSQAEKILKNVRDCFIATLDRHINGSKLTQEKKAGIERSKEKNR